MAINNARGPTPDSLHNSREPFLTVSVCALVCAYKSEELRVDISNPTERHTILSLPPAPLLNLLRIQVLHYSRSA